jgi:hypothetical protein
MLLGLKGAILASGRSQREVSRLTNIPENRLSTIVRGWIMPTPFERRQLVGLLHRSESELFDRDTRLDIVSPVMNVTPRRRSHERAPRES